MDEGQDTRTGRVGSATPGPSRTRRVVTGAAIAAAVAVGGLTVAAVNPLGTAGAEGTATTTSVASSSKGASPTGVSPKRAALKASKVLDDALSSLVADGSLTQAQSDAVRTRVRDTAEAARSDRRQRRTDRRQDLVATAASALGMSADELKGALKDGQTVAQIAGTKGVDPAKVTKALVAEADKLIDEAVSDGRIDAGRAAAIEKRAAARIQRFVESGGRVGGRG